MANTFKVITRDVCPASSGTPETLYTVQTGSTVVVLGMTLANVHTSQVTASVTLVSTTTQTSQTQNTTAVLLLLLHVLLLQLHKDEEVNGSQHHKEEE